MIVMMRTIGYRRITRSGTVSASGPQSLVMLHKEVKYDNAMRSI